MFYGRDQCLEVQAETGMYFCKQYLPSDSGRDMDDAGRTEGGTPATTCQSERLPSGKMSRGLLLCRVPLEDLGTMLGSLCQCWGEEPY